MLLVEGNRALLLGRVKPLPHRAGRIGPRQLVKKTKDDATEQVATHGLLVEAELGRCCAHASQMAVAVDSSLNPELGRSDSSGSQKPTDANRREAKVVGDRASRSKFAVELDATLGQGGRSGAILVSPRFRSARSHSFRSLRRCGSTTM
jgi:hypothetical protein